jgi:polyisoprenoid-binding protein YceI
VNKANANRKFGGGALCLAGTMLAGIAATGFAQMAGQGGGGGAEAGQGRRPAMSPPSKEVSAVLPGAYTLDSAGHSQIIASVNHMGLSNTLVVFNKVSGTLSWDPAKPEESTLDVSVDVASLNSGDARRDDHLRSPTFFAAGQFPTITYKATGLRKIDASTAQIDGNLSLHGVTKPVSLRVKFNGAGTNMMGKPQIGFSARAQVKRSDFGMTAMVPMIADTIDLVIEVEASKAS